MPAPEIFKRISAKSSANDELARIKKTEEQHYLQHLFGDAVNTNQFDAVTGLYEELYTDELRQKMAKASVQLEKAGQIKVKDPRHTALANKPLQSLVSAAEILLSLKSFLDVLLVKICRDKQWSWLGRFSFLVGAQYSVLAVEKRIKELMDQFEVERLLITQCILEELERYKSGNAIIVGINTQREEKLNEKCLFKTLHALNRLMPYFKELESKTFDQLDNNEVDKPERYEPRVFSMFKLVQQTKSLGFNFEELSDSLPNWNSIFRGRKARAKLVWIKFKLDHVRSKAAKHVSLTQRQSERKKIFVKAFNELDNLENNLFRIIHGTALRAIRNERNELMRKQAIDEFEEWKVWLTSQEEFKLENIDWKNYLTCELRSAVIIIHQGMTASNGIIPQQFEAALKVVFPANEQEPFSQRELIKKIIKNHLVGRVDDVRHAAFPLLQEFYPERAYEIYEPQFSDQLACFVDDKLWEVEPFGRKRFLFLLKLNNYNAEELIEPVTSFGEKALLEHLFLKPMTLTSLRRLRTWVDDASEELKMLVDSFIIFYPLTVKAGATVFDSILTESVAENEKFIDALYAIFILITDKGFNLAEGKYCKLTEQALQMLAIYLCSNLTMHQSLLNSRKIQAIVCSLSTFTFIEKHCREVLCELERHWDKIDTAPTHKKSVRKDETTEEEKSTQTFDDFQSALECLLKALIDSGRDDQPQPDFINFQFNPTNLESLLSYINNVIEGAERSKILSALKDASMLNDANGCNLVLTRKLSILIQLFSTALLPEEKREKIAQYLTKVSAQSLVLKQSRRGVMAQTVNVPIIQESVSQHSM